MKDILIFRYDIFIKLVYDFFTQWLREQDCYLKKHCNTSVVQKSHNRTDRRNFVFLLETGTSIKKRYIFYLYTFY